MFIFLFSPLYVELFSADGMLFGALAKCSMCSGWLHYSSGMYRCTGFLSEWSKCSYSTTEPQRNKGKWKIPEDTSNEYLLKVIYQFLCLAYMFHVILMVKIGFPELISTVV